MAGEKSERGNGILLAAVAASVVAAFAMTAAATAQTIGAQASAAASGAAAPPPGPPQWIKLCSPDPMTKKNICVVQETIYADTSQFILSVTFRSTQDDPKMQFILGIPTGMLIQPGIQVQVDMNKPTTVPLNICFPNQCVAEIDINADFVKAVRGGKQLMISAYNQASQPVSFPVSLVGFVKAYDSVGVDPNTPTGQSAIDALTASLKAHADQARQNLIDQQAARPGQ